MNTSTIENNINEDEIDLKELFKTIWENKIKIFIFSTVVTLLTLIYTLSIPNSYKSSTLLIPEGQSKSTLGGLGALAGMAGINIGSGTELDTATSFKSILDDYSFQQRIIKKYNLDKKLDDNTNYIFALNSRAIYDFLNNDIKKDLNEEEKIFLVNKELKSIINISSDKKSGAITISAEHPNRQLIKELVEIYLKELTTHLRNIEMTNVDSQLKYYNSEISKTQDINIKNQLAQVVSGLVQKKVLSMANPYYNVKQLVKPQVPNIKEKTKPKRALLIVVSLVTSTILAIFGIFFINFLKSTKKED